MEVDALRDRASITLSGKIVTLEPWGLEKFWLELDGVRVEPYAAKMPPVRNCLPKLKELGIFSDEDLALAAKSSSWRFFRIDVTDLEND